MIQLQNVTKSFHPSGGKILNDLTLSLKPGEFCIVIGSNGCGKSTLFKLINGIHPADSGKIHIGGKIAEVTQDIKSGTIAEMTLMENIALSQIERPRLLPYTYYRESAIQRLKELGIGLEDFIDLPLSRLSGGQRQMVATLMAIHSGHPILLLDEHTSALDPKMQDTLMMYTAKHVAQRRLTTLMITHKMEDAIRYGNRLIMIQNGNIIFDIKGEKKKELTVDQLMTLFHAHPQNGASHDL